MTLLERFNVPLDWVRGERHFILTMEDAKEIRRALAMAQAVEEWGSDLSEARGERLSAKELILDRADELLKEKTKDPRQENSAFGAYLRGDGK